MERIRKTTFAKISSWLLAVAMVVTGIAVPNEGAYAEQAYAEDVYADESVSDDTVSENAAAYEKLQELIGSCKDYAEEDYTEESWDNLQTALQAAEAIAENASADEIAGAHEALEAAIANLEEKAETSFVAVYERDFNGENENLDEWTSQIEDSSVSPKSEVANNQWELWTSSAQTMTFTHTVENLEAGEYMMSLVAVGGDVSEATLKISSGDAEVTKNVTVNPWSNSGNYTATETELLTLADAGDITITMTYRFAAGGWCNLDDIVLYHKVTANDKKRIEWEKLQTLISECEALDEEQYKAATWNALADALSAAKALTEESPIASITGAYKNLKRAKNSLKDAGIFVIPVEGLTEDFIRGVDISSYISIVESGATFKNENGEVLDDAGFFTLLKESGINYVRVRIWNDPYTTVSGDSAVSRNGYGGGNSDLEKAKRIGKLATDAGMKVLIDFHYSDFWADPERQYAPKAWEDYTVEQKEEALYDFTYDSLEELLDAGVDVGMVQVGNETNNAIAGVAHYTEEGDDWTDMCKLFSAGSRAIRTISTEKSKDILVAVHFTDPQTIGKYDTIAKELSDHKVDYDVFASSYYPNIHGSMENLTKVLSKVAADYDKKVLVAETAWAWTTEDGDGHGNSFSAGNNPDYPISEQGQATVVRDVVQAVVNVENNAGIGVFYWEPAWIPVQCALDEDGKINEEIKEQNEVLWEKYGSGWASSYSGEYDPDHGGAYYGGSVKDNEAFFDFEGYPLNSLTVFKDIFEGTEAPSVKLTVVKNASVEVKLETSDVASKLGEIKSQMPATVTGIYNNSTREQLPVVWNTEEINTISDFGSYTISGTVPSIDRAVSCELTILPNSILLQGDFEGGHDRWTLTGADGVELVWNDTPLRGEGAMHFYSAAAMDFTITQSVKVTDAGIYRASMQLQGGDGSETDDIYVEVSNERTKSSKKKNALLQGWEVWQNPVTEGVEAKTGDTLKVTVGIKAAANAWGSVDDVFLYKIADLTSGENQTQEKPKTETPAPSPKKPGTSLKPSTGGSYKVTKATAGAAEAAFTAPASKTAKKVTIPDTITVDGVSYKVTSVADNAFKKNKKLTTVKLGKNVTSIGKNAFNGCTKLKTVKLDDALTTIGSSAFSGCTALKSVTLPKNVTTIGSKAFSKCKSLKKVTIKSAVLKKVGSGAFKGINAKAAIKVPKKQLKDYQKKLKGKIPSTVKVKK